MRRTRYLDAPCRSALNRVRNMPFGWSLNPYRGCTHACTYCYAVATHAHLGLGTAEFASTVFVKSNLPAVLRAELARPSWRNERVAIGTATDPYQPCEGRHRLTRAALEAFRERGTPVTVVTKSTLVLRDVDLLAALAREGRATVQFSVITLDPAVWRLVEPGTPPPAKRLEVLRRLVEAGVPCGVYLAPILPGITDAEASLEVVVAAAREAGAASVWTSPLRLAPLVKEHWYGFVGEAFPDLLPRYERAYARADVTDAYAAAMRLRLDRIRARHGYDRPEPTRESDTEPRSASDRMGTPRARQLALTF